MTSKGNANPERDAQTVVEDQPRAQAPDNTKIEKEQPEFPGTVGGRDLPGTAGKALNVIAGEADNAEQDGCGPGKFRAQAGMGNAERHGAFQQQGDTEARRGGEQAPQVEVAARLMMKSRQKRQRRMRNGGAGGDAGRPAVMESLCATGRIGRGKKIGAGHERL